MPPRRRKVAQSGAPRAGRSVSFEEFYGGVYGARWPALRKALTAPARSKVGLWNRFCQMPFEKAMPNARRVDDESSLQVFCSGDGGGMQQHPVSDEFNVKAYYLLDYTSVLLVEQLDVGAFDHVLDLCAGSGGASVAIAQFLSADGVLTANEQQGERFFRLRRNVQEHVPSNFVPVTFTQRKAETWHSPSTYHRVLVVAPCTNERRFFQKSGGSQMSSEKWTMETSAELCSLQRALLQRAIEGCRPGGRVVYSTCSISPLENDDVVEGVLQRTRCQVEVIPPTLRIGEKTRYGHLVLPDTCKGCGPMFCCILQKVSDRREEIDDDTTDDDDDDDDEEEEH